VVGLVQRSAVVVTATPAEVERIPRLGHRVTLLGPPRAPAAAEPKAFPPADSGYHDYAELGSETAAVAAVYPNLVRRFSVGTS
jgi:carboxypeptidase T